MNGYILSRAWFNYSFQDFEPKSPYVGVLWAWICEKRNRLGGMSKFGLPTDEAMQACQIRQRKTYYNAFKELEGIGAITLVQESKNQNCARVIEINYEWVERWADGGQFLDAALQNQNNASVLNTQPSTQADTQADAQPTTLASTQPTTHIIKPQTTKHKPQNNDKRILFSESEFVDFDKFQIAFLARFPDYALLYDLSYYHQKLKDWGGGKKVLKYKKVDWILTAKEWMDSNKPNKKTEITTSIPKSTMSDLWDKMKEANQMLKNQIKT